MYFKSSLVFVVAVFVFCEAGYLENIKKCSIHDSDCQIKLFQTVLADISKTGNKELGIPRIDPMEINNMTISIENVIDITMIHGIAKGIKDCVIHKFFTSFEDEHAYIDMTCDFTVKGHYKVFSSSPLIKTFTGGETITGDGNGKVKIDKLHLRLDFDFYVQKRNGDYFIKCKNDKIKYTFDILGKMTFSADKLYIGKEESSKLVTGLLNDNWRILVSSFGRYFMDNSMDIVYKFLHKFFDAVPISYYLTDDMSKYARD